MKEYVAIYFKKTENIIRKKLPNNIIKMQFFQRHNNTIFCGINEVLAFLKKNTDTRKYDIKYLPEGSKIKANEVVLELSGHYHYFGIYEGIIDGILSRATSLATNAYHIKQVTKKDVIFMGDRSDHYLNQKHDGYAINVGGISTQVTDAQVTLHSGKAVGTVPHVLIHSFNGNLVNALTCYQQIYPHDKLVALVDFNNDIVSDTLEVLSQFKNKLWAIRIDTAKNIKDKMFKKEEKEYGVTPKMVKKIRKILDKNNGQNVKINLVFIY